MFKDEDIHRELHFTALLISKHPKRACIWNYRWWLISKRLITDENELAQEFNIAGVNLEAFWKLTLIIIIFKIGAEKYMSNYQAWAYRRKVFHMIPDSVKKSLLSFKSSTLAYARTRKYNKMDVIPYIRLLRVELQIIPAGLLRIYQTGNSSFITLYHMKLRKPKNLF